MINAVDPSAEYDYTWEAPVGSTSLERGVVVDTATVTATLIFEAHGEDNGVFTCRIDNNMGIAVTFVQVGKYGYPFSLV